MSVPSDVVVIDFDHHSEAFAHRPFEILDELRASSPVAWSTAYEGFWVVTDHEHVIDGLADYGTFSSASGPAIPDNAFGTRHIPVALDPPEHRIYRKVLNEWFSKDAITQREPEIRTVVNEVVQPLADRGSWDFVADLANVTPGAVSLGILGWDPSRRLELLNVMSFGLRNQASKEPAVVAQRDEGNRWFREQIVTEVRDRRADPRADLMSVLATQPIIAGHMMTDQEISDTVVLLLLAGFHTTSGALTSLLVRMEHDPGLRQRLEADRDLIPDAIEEIIRIYSPAAAHARKVTTDVEFGGVQMHKGDWTLFINMAANHDPDAFENPEEIDLGRNRSKSVAFGWGVHRCLGLHLARIILRLEVEAIFDQLPTYQIDLDNIIRSPHMGQGYFFDSVPAHLANEAGS